MGRMRRHCSSVCRLWRERDADRFFLAAVILLPKTTSEILRDSAFDIESRDQWLAKARTKIRPEGDVVDIGSCVIDALGTWPWPRETMARTSEAVATAAARCDRRSMCCSLSPTTARQQHSRARLGSVTGRAEIQYAGESLPDGDKRWREPSAASPSRLGFVLDPDRHGTLSGAAVASRGSLPFERFVAGRGRDRADAAVRGAASGLGAALRLPGSAWSHSVRSRSSFPGRVLMPGLAAEALRLASGASSYLVEASPRRWSSGSRRVALSRDALLRLVPVAAWRRVARTLSAVDVSRDGLTAAGWRRAGAARRFRAGARRLRKDACGPADALGAIQADAVEQLLAGRVAAHAGCRSQSCSPSRCGERCASVVLGAALSPASGTGDLDCRGRASMDRRDRGVGLADRLAIADPLHGTTR